jgi:hypothetical protein
LVVKSANVFGDGAGIGGPENVQALPAPPLLAVPTLKGDVGPNPSRTVPKPHVRLPAVPWPTNALEIVTVSDVRVPTVLVMSKTHPVLTPSKDSDKLVRMRFDSGQVVPPPPISTLGSTVFALAMLPVKRRKRATVRKLRIWINRRIFDPRRRDLLQESLHISRQKLESSDSCEPFI